MKDDEINPVGQPPQPLSGPSTPPAVNPLGSSVPPELGGTFAIPDVGGPFPPAEDGGTIPPELGDEFDEFQDVDPEGMPEGEANVRLAASREKDALPKGLVNIGMDSVLIPSKTTQIKGFHTPNAGILVAQFSQYKFIQKKGQASDQNISI